MKTICTSLTRAVHYLFSAKERDQLAHIPFHFSVNGVAKSCIYDGKNITPNKITPALIITFSPEVFSNQPQITVRDLLENEAISLSGEPSVVKVVGTLLRQIDQIKVNRCVQQLQSFLGKNQTNAIQDKPLKDISLFDITSESDVDYLRNKAIEIEKSQGKLAFHLMHLAHQARPHGPYIKRKLDYYRSLGLHLGQPKKEVIHIGRLNLQYLPIPKVACTSIKHLCYAVEHNKAYCATEYKQRHIHDYWKSHSRGLSHDKDSVVVVRDPVKRFLSAYTNRVLDHGALNKNVIQKQFSWLAPQLPCFKPSFSDFLTHFDHFKLVPEIHHHCLPISQWVNGSLDEFSHIFKIEELSKLEALFSDRAGESVFLKREQKSQHTMSLADISREQLDQIIAMYADDYILLAPWYSPVAIVEEWQSLQSH